MRRRALLATLGTVGTPLAGCLGTTGAGRGNPRTLDASVRSTENADPLSLAVEVTTERLNDATPAELRLEATNEGDEAVEYVTGAPEPFAVLTAGEHLLWTDAYRESQHVQTSGRRVTGWTDIGYRISLAPGDAVSETYEFAAPVGTYTVEQSKGRFDLNGVGYTIELSVEER